MITNIKINTRIAYFVMYTKYNDLKDKVPKDDSDDSENRFYTALEELHYQRKLSCFSIFSVILGMRNEIIHGIKHDLTDENKNPITKKLLKNLNPLSVFKNLKVEE